MDVFKNMFDLTHPYFLEIMILLVINIIFQFILIRMVYFRYTRKETFMFAFFIIGLVVFFIGSILNFIQIQIELAVGLVAIFTILRLRTRSITMKDMAYIFAVIGISVINALHLVSFPFLGRVIINCIIILMTIILEEFLARNRCSSHVIIYENIDLLKPERKEELLADLTAMTGKKVLKVKVEEIDYKKRSAELEIFFREKAEVHPK